MYKSIDDLFGIPIIEKNSLDGLNFSMEFICGADLSCSIDQDTNQSNLVSRGTVRVSPSILSGKSRLMVDWFYQRQLISQLRRPRREVRRSVPSRR